MKETWEVKYLYKKYKLKFMKIWKEITIGTRFGIKHCKFRKLLKWTRFNWGVERNTIISKEMMWA